MTDKPTGTTTSETASTTKKEGLRVVKSAKKTSPKTSGTVQPAPPGTVPMTLSDLKMDPKNRRRHGERNLGMITAGLKAVGAARSIVVDETNTIQAGNGVVEAARAAGYSKVLMVDADGDTIVAVRRSGLSEKQKRELAMYDNRAGELAEWNVEQLREDQADGLELKPFFFDREVDAMLRAKGDDKAAGVATEKSEFVIIVTCKTEEAQTELLERFMQEGLECRAVVS